MRRVFLIGGMAVFFLSCSNNGNNGSGTDTGATNVNQASPYTMDTINKGESASGNVAGQDSGTGGGATLGDSSAAPGTGMGKDTSSKRQ